MDSINAGNMVSKCSSCRTCMYSASVQMLHLFISHCVRSGNIASECVCIFIEHFRKWMIHTELTCVKQCHACVHHDHSCPLLAKGKKCIPWSKFGLMWVLNWFIWTIPEIAACTVANIPQSSIRGLCCTIYWQFVSSLIVVMCKACFSPEVRSCWHIILIPWSCLHVITVC